jgi:hypothetical protein
MRDSVQHRVHSTARNEELWNSKCDNSVFRKPIRTPSRSSRAAPCSLLLYHLPFFCSTIRPGACFLPSVSPADVVFWDPGAWSALLPAVSAWVMCVSPYSSVHARGSRHSSMTSRHLTLPLSGHALARLWKSLALSCSCSHCARLPPRRPVALPDPWCYYVVIVTSRSSCWIVVEAPPIRARSALRSSSPRISSSTSRLRRMSLRRSAPPLSCVSRLAGTSP